VTAILALPLLHKFSQGWPLEGLGGPHVVADGFDLQLAPEERFAALTAAIRGRTPTETIVVLGEDPGIHFPTLTRRRLYVPPRQEKPHPGVGEKADDVMKIVKGYDIGILDRRRKIVGDLFEDGNGSARGRGLAQILALGRPVAVVVPDGARHASLRVWLDGRGRRIYSGPDGSVWLFSEATAP
jgi:hypothetical protein